jgi:hypothetical protein
MGGKPVLNKTIQEESIFSALIKAKMNIGTNFSAKT